MKYNNPSYSIKLKNEINIKNNKLGVWWLSIENKSQKYSKMNYQKVMLFKINVLLK